MPLTPQQPKELLRLRKIAVRAKAAVRQHAVFQSQELPKVPFASLALIEAR